VTYNLRVHAPDAVQMHSVSLTSLQAVSTRSRKAPHVGHVLASAHAQGAHITLCVSTSDGW